MPATVSKTDLTRRTRQIVELVQRSNVVVVESYGDECIVLLDMLTYRLLRAYASSGQCIDIKEADSKSAEVYSVIRAYLDSEIDLDRAAKMLHVSRFELLDRFEQLGIPT